MQTTTNQVSHNVSEGNVVTTTSHGGKIHIQTHPSTESMNNTQVCLDSLGLSEVDVSFHTKLAIYIKLINNRFLFCFY